jgi:carbon-monoxide dehydrogenase medium subunit
VRSLARGERNLALSDFLLGFRQVDLQPDEILTNISFPAMTAQADGVFIKLGLRRAQAISVLSVAVVIQRSGEQAGAPLQQARISLGAVAPKVVRAIVAEGYLAGKVLTDETIGEAARLALEAASPIDDIRSSAAYRLGMVETLVARALRQIRDGRTRAGRLSNPVMLWGNTDGKWPVGVSHLTFDASRSTSHESIVNGRSIALAGGMTLLDSLRAAGFTGVKEGCAEGECGACTLFLDGMAVMACMVPAERAAASEVVTVEGLGDVAHLHPVQDAFVQSGGVQCGYCTPGFIMSAAKLLEERSHPTRDEAQEALTGNLCRCTGYRKILDAVVLSGGMQRNASREA